MTDTENGQTAVNNQRTPAGFGAELTQDCSPHVLRRELILMRNKYGATSAIGCRCSNIVELIQMPELPQAQYDK